MKLIFSKISSYTKSSRWEILEHDLFFNLKISIHLSPKPVRLKIVHNSYFFPLSSVLGSCLLTAAISASERFCCQWQEPVFVSTAAVTSAKPPRIAVFLLTRMVFTIFWFSNLSGQTLAFSMDVPLFYESPLTTRFFQIINNDPCGPWNLLSPFP